MRCPRGPAALLALVSSALPAAAESSYGALLRGAVDPPAARVAYGPASAQYAELRLPPGPGPHPIAVVVHGGCWSASFDLRHVRPFCSALARSGVATWCVEYRRVGDEGGGWPGTFEDAARAADHLREVALRHPIDRGRVVAVGHSAGGHLALWLAGRSRLPPARRIGGEPSGPLRGVVALAAIGDLAAAARSGTCGDAVPALLGGSPEERPERYAAGSPAELRPLGVPQRLVHGTRDLIVPIAASRAWVKAGDGEATLVEVPDAGHFDLVDPTAVAYLAVRRAILDLLR